MDYILVNEPWKNGITDIFATEVHDIDTDHKMLIANVRLKLKKKGRVKTTSRIKFHKPSGDEIANYNFFFPPVWPIRTRHGPYNSVSGEKHSEKGFVWSKNAGKSSHQHKQKTKKTQPKTTRKSPSQICVSPKSKQRSNKKRGRAQTKTKPNNLRFALNKVT